MRLTIPWSANSFKGEAFSFLSVFFALHDFGIWVSSVSQIMRLHFPMNKRQLPSFRSLKNDHVLAFWWFIPLHQSWSLSLSADAYMANREWDSLMTMSPSANIGGLKRDSLSADTILGYYYSQLMASMSHLLSP